MGYYIDSRFNEMFIDFIFRNFQKISAIFFKFLIFLTFSFFRHQGPRDPLQVISCCIVSTVNGMVIIILMTPALAIFC